MYIYALQTHPNKHITHTSYIRVDIDSYMYSALHTNNNSSDCSIATCDTCMYMCIPPVVNAFIRIPFFFLLRPHCLLFHMVVGAQRKSHTNRFIICSGESSAQYEHTYSGEAAG